MTEKTTEKISLKQHRAIDALLSAGDVSQAAKMAGINRDTIYKWMRSEPFRQALQDATRASLENLSRSLVTLGDKSRAVLDAILDDPDTRPAEKLRAVDIVLSKLLALRELVDLEERITALERGK